MGEQITLQRRGRKAKAGVSGLIEIAEGLFARHGLDNVSMRHVAVAAGLSNPGSVQYHFGNRENLIRAIWQRRLPELDQKRAHLFAAVADRQEPPTLDALFDCACRPFLADEFEGFSPFLAQVFRSPHHLEVRAEFNNLSPASIQIAQCMRKQLPHLSKEVFMFRILTGTLIVLDSIGKSNPLTPAGWRKSGRERAYCEALAAAVGLLQAPSASCGANTGKKRKVLLDTT